MITRGVFIRGVIAMPFGSSRGQGFNNPILSSFAAGNVRISKLGLVVYAGTPAFGNVVGSISGQGGDDKWGNIIQPGIAGYLGGNVWAKLINGILQFSGGASVGGTSLGRLVLSALTGQPVVVANQLQAVNGTPAEPTVITTDSWHTAVLANGWTGVAQYMLMPDNTVMIRSAGSLAAGTITSGTVIFTVAGIYIPVTEASVPCVVSAVGAGSASTGDDAYLRIDNAGNVEIFNVAVQVATNVRFGGSYSLS